MGGLLSYYVHFPQKLEYLNQCFPVRHFVHSAESAWGLQCCSAPNSMVPGPSGLYLDLMASSHKGFSCSLQALFSPLSPCLSLCMPPVLGLDQGLTPAKQECLPLACNHISASLSSAFCLLSPSFYVMLGMCFKAVVVLNAYALTFNLLVLVVRQGLAV